MKGQGKIFFSNKSQYRQDKSPVFVDVYKRQISCTIEDGSFVLLCGTSGCGKTTMTRLFNGLIPHYHEGTYTGSVYLDGKDTRDLSLFDISLKVGSVFQNPRSQFFNVDTTSELAFGPENHGIAEDLVRDRVKRVACLLYTSFSRQMSCWEIWYPPTSRP